MKAEPAEGGRDGVREPTQAEIGEEVDRLSENGVAGPGYDEPALEKIAALTWRISRLKEEKNAVIAAHVYQRLEVIRGVADFTGDSYRLSLLCAGTPAEKIVFCGVRFMAETAAILNPGKAVYLPAPEAGCSLAESISAEDVRRLKAQHPGAPVVAYINTAAEVKAESDVIVTSSNAASILKKMFARHPRVIFLPDEWMGRNLAQELGKEAGVEMILWEGKCVVHEGFKEADVDYYRRLYPGAKILAHSECSPAFARRGDFIGGTGDMMRFIEQREAPHYLLVTECGFGDLARSRFPRKQFVPMCRLCPYMKATDLRRIYDALADPQPDQIVRVGDSVAVRARRALEKMFELTDNG